MRALYPLTLAALLTACGGGGSSIAPPPVQNASPGGIWTAQWVEASGPTAGDQINLKAVVTENGNFFYAGYNATNQCATVGFGQVTVSGNAVSGTESNAIVTFATGSGVNTTCTYPDGSTFGTGQLSGTITARSSLALTVTGMTSLGMALPTEAHTWSFNALYNIGSALTTVAGNYQDGANVMTIGADGSIFEQDATTGCVLNGTVAPVDAAYDAYNVSFTFSNCTGNAAVLNGLTGSGLGFVDNTVNPSQFLIGIKLVYNNNTIVVVGSLNKL